MLKSVTASLGNAKDVGKSQPINEKAANHVFRVLFGFYGNLFLSKYASGQLNDAGDDLGVASARKVWAYGMRNFDTATIYAALEKCQTTNPEFPPSWPQFLALLLACRPVEVYKPAVPEIPMSQELRSEHARKAREIIAKHEQKAQDLRSGRFDVPQTLDGMKQLIARAVGLAGGDEVGTLLRLDRELAPRHAGA